VVPSGAGLVAASPPGPAQVEGEAGAGDEPGGVLAGEAGQAGGLCDGELDGAGAGRAGLPGEAGDGRVAEGDARAGAAGLLLLLAASPHRCQRRGTPWPAGGGRDGGRGRKGDVAAQRVADGGVAELGERGQGGVPAEGVPGAGLGLVPAQDVLSGLERLLNGPLLMPVK
jgi:hypothetical protein